MRYFKSIFVLCAVALASAAQSQNAGPATPAAPAANSTAYNQIAKDFLYDLIEISRLSKEKKGTKSNETDVLIKRASGRVDFTAVAKKALHVRWAKFPAAQRTEFLNTLQKLLEEVAYPKAQKLAVSRDNFTFEYVEQKEPRVKVLGQVEREKRGEMVLEKIEVQLLFDKKTKKIVDAVLEGEMISQNLRRQFDEAFKKKSFAQIIDQMKSRLNKSGAKTVPAAAPAKGDSAPKGR